jgi:hypothetical protein
MTGTGSISRDFRQLADSRFWQFFTPEKATHRVHVPAPPEPVVSAAVRADPARDQT